MSNAPYNWPHSIDSTPVQKDTIWAKEIPLLCHIGWICPVMNVHYVRNTGVCCRSLILCKSWWDIKFLWILRTFFNCKPVFCEWEWCLKCALKRWPDPGTAPSGWVSLRLAFLQQGGIHWRLNEPTRASRSTGPLCCAWELLGGSHNSVQASPLYWPEHEAHLVLWGGGCLACHSRETLEVMHGCRHAQELLPCVWQSMYLLQSRNHVQISPKADVC